MTCDGPYIGDQTPDRFVFHPAAIRRHFGSRNASRDDTKQVSILISGGIGTEPQIRTSAAFGVNPVARRAEDSKHPSSGFGCLGIGSEGILLSVAEAGDQEQDRNTQHKLYE